MKNIKARRGFTLIELLIVIAVIGLLASIVLVGLSGFRASGRDARRLSEIRQVQALLEQYFNKCGAYPFQNADTGPTGCPSIPATPAVADDLSVWFTAEDGLRDTLRTVLSNDDLNLPQDPLLRGQEETVSEVQSNSYGYSVDWEGAGASGRAYGSYVLQVTLEDTNNPALADSIYQDGIPWESANANVDCDPTAGHYCIGF